MTLCNPMNGAHQASLSMGFSRQEYWSELPCPPPGDLPHPGIKPASLGSPALAGRFFTTSATWEAHCTVPTHPRPLPPSMGVLLKYSHAQESQDSSLFKIKFKILFFPKRCLTHSVYNLYFCSELLMTAILNI